MDASLGLCGCRRNEAELLDLQVQVEIGAAADATLHSLRDIATVFLARIAFLLDLGSFLNKNCRRLILDPLQVCGRKQSISITRDPALPLDDGLGVFGSSKSACTAAIALRSTASVRQRQRRSLPRRRNNVTDPTMDPQIATIAGWYLLDRSRLTESCSTNGPMRSRNERRGLAKRARSRTIRGGIS
jgi:hypothetical protein